MQIRNLNDARYEACQKADEVLNMISYNRCEMIPTSGIMRAVEKTAGVKIRFAICDFEKYWKKGKIDFASQAVAMNIKQEEDFKIARILVNERQPLVMQRFGLIHALGRIAMGTTEDICEDSDKFRMLVHVDMDIDSIPNDLLEKSEYDFMIPEQAANYFALFVTIPMSMLQKQIRDDKTLTDMAMFFGVSREAIMSRLKLEIAK